MLLRNSFFFNSLIHSHVSLARTSIRPYSLRPTLPRLFSTAASAPFINPFLINDTSRQVKQIPPSSALIPDFTDELHDLEIQIPENETGDLSEKDTIQQSFFRHCREGDRRRALVSYYDFKDLEKPTILMSQFMFIFAAIDKDKQLMEAVYRDIIETKYLDYTLLLITLLLKGFSQVGSMATMLDIYENNYKFGFLPENVHWKCMLKGAATSGDPKHFARFYYRLKKMDVKVERDHLKQLLHEWGTDDSWQWKRSKACNCQPHDFIYLIEIALKVRNYKRAIQFINDIFLLDRQPTYQAYEMFLEGVNRDYPAFRHEVREWRLKWKDLRGPADKTTISTFAEWTNKLKEYIGLDKLDNAVRGAKVIKPERPLSRKQRLLAYGMIPEKRRYESQYTDDSRLFEYVPWYTRRLERESEEFQEKRRKEALEREIESQIENAKMKQQEWNTMGFYGDYSAKIDEEDIIGEIPEDIKIRSSISQTSQRLEVVPPPLGPSKTTVFFKEQESKIEEGFVEVDITREIFGYSPEELANAQNKEDLEYTKGLGNGEEEEEEE